MQNISTFKFSEHVHVYPLVIPRAQVSLFFPWLSAKRLCHLDQLGLGPKGSFRNGRAVLYPTRAFLEWLDERTQPQKELKNDHIDRSHAKKKGTPVAAKRGRKSKQQEVRERRG